MGPTQNSVFIPRPPTWRKAGSGRILIGTRAEDKATQGCDLSADPGAEMGGRLVCRRPSLLLGPFWPESDKSQGYGDRVPMLEIGHLQHES
jgi:hypothetical protein